MVTSNETKSPSATCTFFLVFRLERNIDPVILQRNNPPTPLFAPGPECYSDPRSQSTKRLLPHSFWPTVYISQRQLRDVAKFRLCYRLVIQRKRPIYSPLVEEPNLRQPSSERPKDIVIYPNFGNNDNLDESLFQSDLRIGGLLLDFLVYWRQSVAKATMTNKI